MMQFIKMNGLGNDFIILDHRDTHCVLSQEQIVQLAHRRFGIGCDQLIILEEPQSSGNDVFMRIFNADGLEAGACGNAMRCVAQLLFNEFQRETVTIQTRENSLVAYKISDDKTLVDLGAPIFTWDCIPLAQPVPDPLNLDIHHGVLKHPATLSVGNPHLIFFVEDVQGLDIMTLGQTLSEHPLFPEKTNVEFVEVVDDTHLRIRVYERGAGVTMACGTGAAASVVAACGRGLCARGSDIRVQLDGGMLHIRYEDNVTLAGTSRLVYQGVLDSNFFNHREKEIETCVTHPQTSIKKGLALDA